MVNQVNVVTRQIFKSVIHDQHNFVFKQLSYLNRHIRADYLFIAVLSEDGGSVKSLLNLIDGVPSENFAYDLKHTPCEKVTNNQLCSVNEGIADLYPKDILLKEMGIQGYIGEPVFNNKGNVLGIIVSMYKQPQTNLQQYHFAFSMLATYVTEFVERRFYSTRLRSQIALHNKVEDMSLVGAWEYDITHNQLAITEGVIKIFDVNESDDVTLDSMINFYTPECQQQLKSLIQSAAQYGEPYCCELQIVDSAGQQKWVRTNGEPKVDDAGKVVKLFGAIEDISEQRKLIKALKTNNSRLADILDNLNDGVISVDQNGIIESVNRIACIMFGCPLEELLGQNVSVLMPEPYSSTHGQYLDKYAETGKASIMGVGRQLPGKRKNGEIFQMELSLTQTTLNGRVQFIGIVRDISERIQAQDTIYNLAYTDPISGLKNKQWFEKEFQDLVQSKSADTRKICFALLDIDNMAQFNLKFGFDKGNQAIAQIADNLKSLTSSRLRIYKNGADSFLLLSLHSNAPDEDNQSGNIWLNKGVLNPSNYLVTVGRSRVEMSVSIGSCVYDAKNHCFETVLDTLEHSVQKAKDHKPFGNYHLDGTGVEAYERIKKIHHALDTLTESNELSLVLQPQYTADNTVASSEALIRWHSKELGFVSPAEFIPIAEKTDAIIQIGDWILDNVCQLLSAMQKQGVNTRVAVNISAKQIVSTNFKHKLLSLIDEYALTPDHLMLELTETTLVSDIELVKSVMIDMRKEGFRFSIDDFGTGYSSLNYLKELPISELKIDKHFVDDILADTVKSGGMIVSLIIDMAKILGVNCVAEGVETGEQVEFLNARQCALFQGYYFSKPVDKATWTDIILNERPHVSIEQKADQAQNMSGM